MKKNLLFFFIIVSFFSACTREQPLEIAYINFSEKELDICSDLACPEVSVSYVQVQGGDERALLINSEIVNFIIKTLYLGDENASPTAKTVEAAAIEFIRMYRTHNAEFPGMQLDYFADIQANSSFNSVELISIEVDYYLFTGGAHGYGGTTFFNFDARTGVRLTTEDLFRDVGNFEEYAERKFRESNEIPASANINDTGFWFDNDRFHLPESIGFTESSVVLIYNPYEIASYAAGPVELFLSLEEASPYFSKPLQ